MRESVIIKNWPFEKGEKVRLTWIGEPFKYNNKWMLYAYFNGDKYKRKIMLDWASVHFLAIDKYYVDGDLNNALDNENAEVININLSDIKPEYKEKDWTVWGTGFSDKYKSKTFNFFKDGTLYSIPLIEIIRAVLAPNRFILNTMLELDSLDSYFTYDIDKYSLDIYFTSQYRYKDLNSERIKHIAWIITNSKILRMFKDIGYNLLKIKELKFDFLFKDFYIKARVEKRQKYVRIVQILGLYEKKINVAEINVYHPNLEEARATNEPKKRRFFNSSTSGEIDLDSSASGAAKASEDINTFEVAHEYSTMPKISKKKIHRKVDRKLEDENTKSYVIEDDRIRTTADEGGENLIKGLEFVNLNDVNKESSLNGFLEVLRLIEKRQEVKSVEILIGNLPEGTRGKKFSKLSDGITKRKFVVGKIIMADGGENCLIDIERENRTLSILLLKSYDLVNWDVVCNMALLGLVNESGKWSNEVLNMINKENIRVVRKNHTSNSSYEKEKHIYNLICP